MLPSSRLLEHVSRPIHGAFRGLKFTNTWVGIAGCLHMSAFSIYIHSCYVFTNPH